MALLKNYYKKIIKYDLINKFTYKQLKEIPKLKKVNLNFGCNNFDCKSLASTMLAFELITNKQGKLTNLRQPNLLLKIKKGAPVGCSLTLYKTDAYNFCFKLINEIFPNLKEFKGFVTNKKQKTTTFSFTIKELITFNELETHFYLFSNLPKLNITMLTDTQTQAELLYLLKSLKIPLN
jgi:large subunit ribosomal protein L5